MTKSSPFVGERVDAAAMNVEIAGPLKNRVYQEARRRRISKRSIIEKALEAYFEPHQEAQREAMIARRLLNLDRRFESIEWQNKILEEAVAVSVHSWLVQNPEIAGDEKAPTNVQAQTRYNRHIEGIARNFETRTKLYDELPQMVMVPSRRAEPVAPDTASS